MKWSVKFVDEVWLESNGTTVALNKAGYAAGAFKDEGTGVRTYTLHRADDKGYPIIYETESLDQLNAYINLILPRD